MIWAVSVVAMHEWELIASGVHLRLMSACIKDQPVKIVGEFSECEFGLGTRKPDGADRKSVAVLLMREDMLGPGPHC